MKFKGTGETFEAALKDAMQRRHWEGNDTKAFVTDHVIETWYDKKTWWYDRAGRTNGTPHYIHTVEVDDA